MYVPRLRQSVCGRKAHGRKHIPVFIHLFICTFIKYLLSINCELSPRKEQE